ncbi:TPA: lysine biosynthesis protein LysX [Candidatus Acetothermia bacterium]|nr:lysine biosynthesis protein LysX [Candidatus Acetothermia bacterium]
MRIGVVCSRVRVEEKLILAALRERGVDAVRIDPRGLPLWVGGPGLEGLDAVLLRCVSHTEAFYVSRWLAGVGIPTVNRHPVVATCGDKFLTSMALAAAGLPQPHTALALSRQAAFQVLEGMGYPAVLKPVVGSWGRLVALLSDRHAAEGVIEHKLTLGSYQHSALYLQEYVEKPGRDIRALVAGHRLVYAVYRESDHWITNTARGGRTKTCPVTPELSRLAVGAAQAVGGGLLAVDILETADGRLLIGEVNHTPEFHGAMEAVDVDVPGAIADYVIELAKEGR